MRPADHFLSKADRISPAALDGRTRRRFERDFGALVAPVLGAAAAEDLYNRTLDRAAGSAGLRKLGFMAAFFLGEYDEETMPLEREDWEEIRGTLEDVSGEINIKTLGDLMGELLSRGMLD
ncbi:MAG: hypothetical protein LBG14_07650 [Treponema sp.]|jgi:hypothetical protein|nr:hypothetical protein [Treponema sp.]